MTTYKQFNEKVKNLPVGFAGLALGLAGLGNAWTIILQEGHSDWSDLPEDLSIYTHTLQIICFILSIFFCGLVIYRQIVHYKVFWAEMHDPVAASVMATITMTLLLISGFIAQTTVMGTNDLVTVNGVTIFASVILYFAIFAHLGILIVFIWKVFAKHDFKRDHVYATWLVPPIGIVVSCVVSEYFPTEIVPSIIFEVIWFMGFSLFILLFPYIVYKTTFADNLPNDRLGTLGIVGAPANLSLTGFLSVKTFETWGDAYWVIIAILTILAIPTTLYLYIFLFKILQSKFNPTFAGLTFPTSIGATSVLKLSSVVGDINNGTMNTLSNAANIMGYIFITVSTFMITYVLIRFAILLFNNFHIKKYRN